MDLDILRLGTLIRELLKVLLDFLGLDLCAVLDKTDVAARDFIDVIPHDGAELASLSGQFALGLVEPVEGRARSPAGLRKIRRGLGSLGIRLGLGVGLGLGLGIRLRILRIGLSFVLTSDQGVGASCGDGDTGSDQRKNWS